MKLLTVRYPESPSNHLTLRARLFLLFLNGGTSLPDITSRLIYDLVKLQITLYKSLLTRCATAASFLNTPIILLSLEFAAAASVRTRGRVRG